jgi:hypothetical protein
MDPSNENRPAGGSTSNNLSEFRSDTSKDDEPEINTGVSSSSSSSYAISSRGETTDLRGALALRPHHGVSASTGEEKSLGGDRAGQDEKSEQEQSTIGEHGGPSGDSSMPNEHEAETATDNDGTRGEPKGMKEYSAAARTYHAFYDEVRNPDFNHFSRSATDSPKLQRAHLRGHYTWCRDNCLKLLAEPRIPLWTRIQTLQLLSTMLQPAGGEQCLHEADRLIEKLAPNQFQTKLLREDNRTMKADRMDWRIKNDMVGKDIESVTDEGPSEEQLKLDRELDEKLRQELELDHELDEKLRLELEEMESIRRLDN